MDEFIRTMVGALAALAALAGVVGGFVRPVDGRWRDGQAELTLRQRGLLVTGRAEVEGGRQRFVGIALYGHARLRRYDYGGTHLGMLGFNHKQWPQLEGQALAKFHMTLRGNDELTGSFVGRRFSFVGAELKQSSWTTPVPRRWNRVR